MLSGSLLADDGLTEFSLASSGERQLLISLEGATWLDAPFWLNASNSLALLDALHSSSSAASGWNAVVVPRMRPRDVAYIDGTTLAVRVWQFATYAIDAPETVQLTVPAHLLRATAAPLAAGPSLLIRAQAGQPTIITTSTSIHYYYYYYYARRRASCISTARCSLG